MYKWGKKQKIEKVNNFALILQIIFIYTFFKLTKKF